MYRILLFIIALSFLNQTFAQNKADLEQKRESIQKEIERIGKRLQLVNEDKKEALESAILNLIGNNNDRPDLATTKGDMTADFIRSKSKLSWPLKDGFVERFFGRQPHPTLSRIEVVNNGIDIRAISSPAIYASFAGTVAGKFTLPSGMQSLLIKHGDFYTVYSNIDQIFVQKGDQVSTQQETRSQILEYIYLAQSNKHS